MPLIVHDDVGLNVPRCRADGRAVMMMLVLMSLDVGLMAGP